MSHRRRGSVSCASGAIACALVALVSGPVYAQSSGSESRLIGRSIAAALASTDQSGWPVATLAPQRITHRPLPRASDAVRPKALVPLYVSFGALQALDAHSTLRAIGDGHSERNPFVGTFTTAPGAIVGLKLASTAGTIYLTERLWRRHRAAAIALMIAVNGAYAAIVAHNYGVRKD